VAVLPRDDRGRLLLVRHADDGQWGTIGGLIEVDEAPADAAIREAREEAGVEVTLGSLRAALGGAEFHIEYSNGDRAAYVSIVYDAEVVGGTPRADDDEISALEWVRSDRLAAVDLSPFARATFSALDLLPGSNAS